MRTGRLARRIGWSLAVGLAVGSGTASSAAGHSVHDTAFRPASTGSVRIDVKLNAQRRGTFAIAGAATDTGTGTARRTVSGTRLVLVETLKSARGTLVLRMEQLCAKTTGGWRVLAGTAAYAGTTGSGTTTVRSPCLAGPLRIAHTGRLKIPPPPTPPPAVPAKVLYGGWTGQDEDVALEVAGDGRTITLIHIGRVSAPCAPNAGPFSTAEIRITGPVPVADDGTFTAVQAPVTVTGRLVQGRIEGTLALQTSYPSYQPGQTITCSASGITWNATSPPPPPRVALPGTYCGFNNQGKGICIDVAPDGLTVTSVRDGIRVSCGSSASFDLGSTDNNSLSLRPNLSFARTNTVTFDGGGGARHYFYGSFDTTGTVKGSTRFEAITVIQGGTTYTCAGETSTFEAKLQR